MNPSELQACLPSVIERDGGLTAFRQAIPDFELWLRNKTVMADDSMTADQLEELRHLCAHIWTMPDAVREADLAVSVSALSRSLLDNLARHIRVGGVILAVDESSILMNNDSFESMVAPTGLEIVRRTLPQVLACTSRSRRPVSCVLRRRN